MKRVIKLKSIYSDDLYTRSRASELRACINEDTNIVIFDFEQIGFMSRAFADELCNIMDDFKDVTFEFVNRSDEIEAMMNNGRMSAYGNNLFTKPNNTLANIFDILTCSCHYESTCLCSSWESADFITNIRKCLISMVSILGVNLSIMDAGSSFGRKVFFLETDTSHNCSYLADFLPSYLPNTPPHLTH